MDKRELIAKIITESRLLKELNYSNPNKEFIDSFKTGFKNYLGLSFKNKAATREIIFGFFEFSSEDIQSNSISILVNCLDCKKVKFTTFCLTQYNYIHHGTYDVKELSLNYYPDLTLEDKIQAVLTYFETVFSQEDIKSMLLGESWLDGYYYYVR